MPAAQALLRFRRRRPAARVYRPFIAILKLPFKIARPYSPQQAGKRRSGNNKAFHIWDRGRTRGRPRPTTIKGRPNMFHGTLDLDGAVPVAETAIQDLLFERGLYWASGRSGVVNLIAAHKWFNLAALKGRPDAIALRREVAEQMSETEIAAALSEARAWMTAH